jgi:hypothetical protein
MSDDFHQELLERTSGATQHREIRDDSVGRSAELPRTISLAFAAICLALHCALNARGGYGYFRDELYYLACSRHPAAGYVDQPPLSILVLGALRALFGDSLFALRLWPALASAVVVYATGRLAQRFGAGSFGQCVACLAALCSPIALGFGGYYSMNAFDLVVWVVAAHLFVSVLDDPRPRRWIVLGVVLGLGLLNKISVLWLVLGMFVGLVLTPHRRLLRTPWPWIAGAIALALFAPFVAWNVAHQFAHLEFIRNATAGKYSGLSTLSFLGGLIPTNHPLSLPLWLGGLAFLLRSKSIARYRPLAWVWMSACAVLAINGHSKPEYLAAAFPILFASGGAAIDRLRGFAWRWIKLAYVALFAATSALIAPLVLPILPVESYIRYADALGVAPSTSEKLELGRLPQHFADMFGWEEKAAAVASVYAKLSPEDRRDCAIFASNYGRAGAIDFFGQRYGLPAAIGEHNNYWIWGPRGHTGKLVIVLGRSLGERASMFESVEVAATVPHDGYCMPYEDDLSVFVCRNSKVPLAEMWPELKHFQ